jgi:hypothetical protein
MELPNHQSKVGAFGSERFKTNSRRLSPVSVKTSAYSDHASRAALVRLISTTPLPCRSFLAFVTIPPLYRTTVSPAFRRRG